MIVKGMVSGGGLRIPLPSRALRLFENAFWRNYPVDIYRSDIAWCTMQLSGGWIPPSMAKGWDHE
ncbi:hypothetical protein, partial [Bifidobacterium bifidum]|uniref:hypothetical protein n=1 Tax=Bifidobacterium bifidum TaxID=1681 RepID=UPI003262F31D